MITKISIRNAATFGDTTSVIDKLKKFNYFFGANGTGKTTISRVIADSTQFPESNVSWAGGQVLESKVYNRDFVESNFTPSSTLKGVFTLGQQEADTLSKIADAKNEIDRLSKDIKDKLFVLQGEDSNGGKKAELAQHEEKYKSKFFEVKQKHDKKLAGGLEGFRSDKEKFKNKVLTEATNNTAELKSLDDIEERAATIFSKTLVTANSIAIIQPEKLIALELAPILTKRVIGKENVDIAAIIKKLNNSDWVRQGLAYYKANDNVCPFCQQKTDENFAKSLSEYFDEAFERDTIAINTLLSDYSTESNRIQQQLQAIMDIRSEFIDGEKLESEKNLLDSIITVNIQKLVQKKKEASQIIELDSLKNVLEEIVALIASANDKINKHNTVVGNISQEKTALTTQIWKFIVSELNGDIAEYNQLKNNLNSAISNIEAQLETKRSEKISKEAELRDLEKKTVSIQPTIDSINKILTSFGFKSFNLAKGTDEQTYKLQRPNGDDAHSTLSEGERNFVSFLYFYHLLKGSHTESGITQDKIVVFDDPVSSLDSDVLFIVSSLVRDLFEDVTNGNGTIKQIFVLTHNVYFHKEVTYNSKRNKDGILKGETFWLVNKRGIASVVESQTSNPIKTAYDLLWDEVRKETRNNATIQNTLRRILENYFRLLGGINLDTLYTKFDGDDKITCKALCLWVNDGSHSVFDDEHYTALDDTSVSRYLDVFKQIFERHGHISHYNMMMGISPESDDSYDETDPAQYTALLNSIGERARPANNVQTNSNGKKNIKKTVAPVTTQLELFPEDPAP